MFRGALVLLRRGRLALLYLLLLGSVLLLQLLCLLSVAFLHLLFLLVAVVFLYRLLMFLFLLLLQLLMFLRLLRGKLVLLLLIFLVSIGVAGGWRLVLVRLQFGRILRRSRGRRLIFAARLLGGHDTGLEVARLRSGCDRRHAMIRASP